MNAILLTYDARHFLANLVVNAYEALWPDNDFIFKIPYNKNIFPINNPKCNFIHTPKDVKRTMISLLANIDDEEFVYWCLDDIYPVSFYNLNVIKNIFFDIKAGNIPAHIDAIRFVRKSGWAIKDKLQFRSATYCLKNLSPWSFYGFWFHYFIRAKILKKILIRDDLPLLYTLRYIPKFSNQSILFHNVYVTDETLVLFGETTRNNGLTQNCIIDAKRFGVAIPPNWPRTKYHIYNNRGCSNRIMYRKFLLKGGKMFGDV